MKYLRLLLLIAPVLLIVMALRANAQVYVNGVLVGATASATPKAVGVGAAVLVIPPAADRRCSITMTWPEAGNLSCLPVATGQTNAGTAPTATNGFLFASGKTWSATGMDEDTRLGWQCISTTGTVNVSTEEVYHCSNTKTGM